MTTMGTSVFERSQKMNVSLDEAIRGCKPSTPAQVWVGFTFVNDLGVLVKQKQVKLSALYKDWYGECNVCPPNDAKITNVNMRTDVGQRRFDLLDTGLEFGDFMDTLEKNWKFRRIKGD